MINQIVVFESDRIGIKGTLQEQIQEWLTNNPVFVPINSSITSTKGPEVSWQTLVVTFAPINIGDMASPPKEGMLARECERCEAPLIPGDGPAYSLLAFWCKKCLNKHLEFVAKYHE